MPYEGMANSMDGQNTILSVVGPISTSVAGLRLSMKALLSQEPWNHDPLVHDMPWRDDIERQVQELIKSHSPNTPGLSFAIMKHDGVVAPHPPVLRALNMVEARLKELKYEVIEWKPPSHYDAITLVGKVWSFDGGADCNGAFALSGEPIAKQVLIGNHEPLNATQIAAINVQKREYQKLYMDYWNSTAAQTKTGRPVDAVICPLAPFTAARIEGFTYYGYSLFVNLLDYSSAIVPVTTADKNLDVKDASFRAANPIDQQTMDTCKFSYRFERKRAARLLSRGCLLTLWALDDADVYDGAPVCVQIMGRRLQEEKVLAIAEHVAEEVRRAGGRLAKI
jgi:amidase